MANDDTKPDDKPDDEREEVDEERKDPFLAEPEDVVLLDKDGHPLFTDPDDPERFWDEEWEEEGAGDEQSDEDDSEERK